MKGNKFKNIMIILVVLVILISMCISKVYGAGSFNISVSNTSIYVGNTITLTIKTSDCAGKFNITSSDSSVISISESSVWVDGTTVVTLVAKSSGTANIVITAVDVTDIDLNDVKGSKTVTVKVNTKQSTTGNTTNNSNPSTSSKPSTSDKINATTSNTSTTKVVSNNAYLKEFRVDIPGMTPDFNKNSYNYVLTVDESVENVNVTAISEDNKATVSVSGNTNLKIGDNVITIKVVAEDKKTTKTYIITVTKTEDIVKSNAYLQNIIVKDLTINPDFSKEVFEYELENVESNVDKIDVSAFAENENASVEIKGNDNLVAGENLINITVTSENGKNQKIYTLKLIKDEEKLAEVLNNETDAKKAFRKAKFQNMKEILKEKLDVILLYFLVWVEFLQIVYLYEKLKKEETINHI